MMMPSRVWVDPETQQKGPALLPESPDDAAILRAIHKAGTDEDDEWKRREVEEVFGEWGS